MVAELVSAVVTWAGIGWLLDRWLDTGPVLLLIGIVIGTVAGFYLVLIRHNRMIAEMAPPYGSRPRPKASSTPNRPLPDPPTTEGAPRGTD